MDDVLIDSKNNMQLALAVTSKKLNIHIDFNKYIEFLRLPFEKILSKIHIFLKTLIIKLKIINKIFKKDLF